MKNSIGLLIIILISLSCAKTKEEGATEKINSVFEKPSAEKNKTANGIAGYWMSEPYLSSIEKTNTVYLNRNFETTLFGFILDKENLLGDSATLHGFTDHEGGYSANIKYNKERKIFENDISRNHEYANFKEPFEIKLIGTNQLRLHFLKSGKNEIYRKVVDDDTELRKILFEGNYIDSLSGNKIRLTKEGKVEGIDGYSYFTVMYDFGEGLNYDCIFLFKEKENYDNQQILKYKISSDTILFYPVTGEVPEWSIGELKYRLVKR